MVVYGKCKCGLSPSDFKMLPLASNTLIYALTAEINCYYLMALSVLRYAV